MNTTLPPGRGMNDQPDPLEELKGLRRPAPADFARRVMGALADEPAPRRWSALGDIWPERGRWWLPALAGAAAALLGVALVQRVAPRAAGERITVHFELKAPEATRVELVGDFTGWKPDVIRLEGPDALGCWSADVPLPAGRHEYIFLVDGTQWRTDPRATVRRDDGFGRENAVVAL